MNRNLAQQQDHCESGKMHRDIIRWQGCFAVKVQNGHQEKILFSFKALPGNTDFSFSRFSSSISF